MWLGLLVLDRGAHRAGRWYNKTVFMLVAFAVVYGTQVKLDVAIKLKDHCVTSGSSPAPQIGIGPSTL
jgi:hypothetical protein